MSGFSTYLANSLSNHVLRGSDPGGAYSRPTNLYLTFHTADPTDSGSVDDELDTFGWTRKLVTFTEATDGAAKIDNQPIFTFPTCTVTHFSIWDSPSGSSNMLFSDSLPTPLTFNEGETYIILEDTFTINWN